MPRNMSFSLTTTQFRNRTKTVTRRGGWLFLVAGDEVMGCEKCRGIKAGELVRLGMMRITSARRERLDRMIAEPEYGKIEAAKEGFPNLDGKGFVDMYCDHMSCEPSTIITRIEFEYLDE